MTGRDVYKPMTYTLRIFKAELGIDIYIYTTASGKPAAIGWNGSRQVKPEFRYTFRSEAEREAHVKAFIKKAQEAAEKKAKYEAENKAFSFTVGEILSGSYGYEQTNVHFYEVMAVTPTFLTVREIKSDAIPTGDMTTKEMPIPGDYTGDHMRRKIWRNVVFVTKSILATKWDGQPEHGSSYG